MKISLMILSFVFLPLVSLADCPLGAKEDHLTISRVMRNFGRFTLPADSLCLKGINPPERESISDSQITDAIAKLSLAVDCAEAVLKNPTGDVLPSHLELMTDAKAKAQVVDDYIYFMTDFRDGLKEYQDILGKLLTQPSAERNYTEANDKRQELDTLVERAHKKVMN